MTRAQHLATIREGWIRECAADLMAEDCRLDWPGALNQAEAHFGAMARALTANPYDPNEYAYGDDDEKDRAEYLEEMSIGGRNYVEPHSGGYR